MEWLSHSQKKYCELCKTPFRFTKFYNPNMPHTLPVTVFARQVGRYVLENSLGWLRAAVAILFWLVGLPWFMRCGWAAMLWLSQESWSGSTVTPTIDSDSSSTIHLSSTLIGFDMCPASPLFAPTMTPAAEVDNMLGWWANQTVTQLLVHCFFWMFGIPSPAIVSALSGRPVTSYLAPPTPPRKTLLNNVSFLKTLTRSPILNTEIIYTLEGQIITIVVIVSFVLIILVRDYVVQQQPEINMREPFEEAEEVLPTPVAVEPARPILEEDDDFGIDDDSEEDLPAEEQPTEPPSRRESFAFGRVHGPMGAHTVHEYRDDDGQRAAAELARATTQPAHSAHFPQGWTEDTSFHRRQSDGGSTNATFTPDHSQSEGTDLDQAGSSSGEAKGKERARDVPDRPQPVPLVDGGAGPSRPRAVSDGPQMHSTINPLANNTWSFTAAHDILQSDTPQCETPLPEAAASPFAEAAHQEALDSIIPTATHANLADLGDREERSSSAGRAGPSSNPVPAPAVAPRSAHDEPFEGVEATDHAQPAEAAAPRPPLPERLTDFMWGDIPDADFNPFIDAAGYEGPEDDQWQDVPMDEREDQDIDDLDDDFDVDDGVAGMDPGLDPEVVDDMDDFEGIMELLGMRGPITNLFQNVIFCAVLVQAALFIGIFIPFNLGRISLWFVAKPARLILMVYEMAKVTQDLMFALTGFLGWVVFNLMDMATGPVGGPVATHVLAARKTSWGFFAGAVNRIVSFFDGLSQDLSVPGSGMQMWSAASHEALLSIQHKIISALTSIGALFSLSGLGRFLTTAPQTLGQFLQTTLTAVSKPGGWAANLTPSQTPPVNLDNSYWPAGDLTWAILVGYATMLLISAVYLKTGFRFARGTSLEDWEIGLVDTLHQASGVLKVITIIGIEMLVFPLYCGLLLDCALLPLFAGASVSSRLQFTYNSPWTSVFVHWFVGTGYMFHFALFVSMCRKIMRPGVLCKFLSSTTPLTRRKG